MVEVWREAAPRSQGRWALLVKAKALQEAVLAALAALEMVGGVSLLSRIPHPRHRQPMRRTDPFELKPWGTRHESGMSMGLTP